MNQAFVEYYRCPENLATFRLVGPLSADPGYFRFGAETICYGNSSSGARSKVVTGSLYDALAEVTATAGTLRLPVDPDELIENLRYERYEVPAKALWGTAHPMVHRLYYGLRPFLPVPVRQHLQRARLTKWRNIPFPHWPVDRTVEELLDQLLVLSMKAQGVPRLPFIWFWPDGASSCAIMTHDVEQLAGRNFCSQLMDLDESVGIKSSFQLVPEGRYPVPEELLEEIRTRGFELGIHDLNHDGHLFSSREKFLRRAQKINAYGRRFGAFGFRSGALYRNQAWYDALEFSYDMSVPSVAHLDPQRGGCCSLMPFFIGRLLELPLTTIQDYSLFHVLKDYSIGVWKQQIDSIIERHGLATFIVHPDYIIDNRARTTYQALLEYLATRRDDRRLWLALPRDVNRWWRERHHMRIVPDGHRWRIEGTGKERARLAFASVVGETLTFTIEG